jgi:hypothetical protein
MSGNTTAVDPARFIFLAAALVSAGCCPCDCRTSKTSLPPVVWHEPGYAPAYPPYTIDASERTRAARALYQPMPPGTE